MVSFHYRTRYVGDRLLVQLPDLMADGPPQVVADLLAVALADHYRRKEPADRWSRYLAYRHRREVVARAQLLYLARNRQVRTEVRGSTYDLGELFDGLNALYFRGELPRPALAWTARPSRGTLGFYLEDFDVVVLSPVLDGPTVPRYAIESILYHELLHKAMPHTLGLHTERHHPPEFRAAERRFLLHEPAKAWTDAFWRTTAAPAAEAAARGRGRRR